MATNNIKPFAIGNGANVTSQADYEALAALLTGFQSGKASSAQINKALRQSSFVASVLAQFISDAAGVDVLDNGDTAVLLTSLITALKTNSANDFLQKSNNLADVADKATSLGNLGGAPLASPTLTGTPKAPTATAATNTTQIATTAFVQALIAGLLKASNNLSEIAAAGPSAVAAALLNLGLGDAAKRTVGTGTNQIPDMSSFASTLANAGVQPLPGGLKIMWGRGQASVGGSLNSFPVPFTTEVYLVVGIHIGTVPGNPGAMSTDSTTYNIYGFKAYQSVSSSPASFGYIALGK